MDLLNSRAGRAFCHRYLELCEGIPLASRSNLDVTVGFVPYPSFESKLASLVDDEPAKSNTLHASTDFQVDAIHSRASV